MSDSEAAAKPDGRPLSLGQARAIVITMTGSTILFAVFGRHELLVGKTLHALLYCFVAVCSLLTLPIYVFLYLQVKKGAAVVMRRVPLPSLPHAPFLISVVLIALMTLMVLVMGGVTIYTLPRMAGAFNFRIFLVVLNALLWLITGFLWYRILSEKHRPQKFEPVLEHVEGVWPPAPQIPKNE